MIKHQQEGDFHQSQVSFNSFDYFLPVLIAINQLKPLKMPFLTYFLVFLCSTRKLLQDDSFGASNASNELPRAQFILFAIYIPSNSWQYLEINLVNGSLLFSDCINHLENIILIKTLNVPATWTFYLIFYLPMLHLANNKITSDSIRILAGNRDRSEIL